MRVKRGDMKHFGGRTTDEPENGDPGAVCLVCRSVLSVSSILSFWSTEPDRPNRPEEPYRPDPRHAPVPLARSQPSCKPSTKVAS